MAPVAAQAPSRRRRNRWGDAPPPATDGDATSSTNETPAAVAAAAFLVPPPPLDAKAKLLALKASVAARLAAAKLATTTTTKSHPVGGLVASNASNVKRPAPEATAAAPPPPMKKAKVYELDLTTTGPTFQASTLLLPAPPKKKTNPYLAHQEEGNGKTNNYLFNEKGNDERLVRSSKPRQRHKPISFVEPGTYIEIAERKRERAANAEQSGFLSGRKKGEFIKSSGIASVYGSGAVEGEDTKRGALAPRVDASIHTRMPLIMEWWDMELLPSKLKKEVAEHEGRALSKKTQAQLQQLGTINDDNDDDEAKKEEKDPDTTRLQKECWEHASFTYSKTSTLVQHIVPVKPPGVIESANQPTLYLTKKELKRQRKLRRAEKQRELQDMQAAGLVAPPEARLTLKNFISVLGDQAYLDPSQMEKKVNEQVQARQRAHMERNEASKLTKDQRKIRKAKKMQEDTSHSVAVALFYVKDMSHAYHRTKVDLNAQQNNITGGVLECASNPSLSCVICEGGPKAIKRYTRLMLVRMKWQGQGWEEDDDNADENDNEKETAESTAEEKAPQKFNTDNKCELVWTGMGAKRMFPSFVFQSCESSDIARKVLEAKGVAHFWDQVLTHASGQGESFHLKLGESDDDEEHIVMMEE